MKKWLKRIRGALGMGLTWAAAWFGVGMIVQSALLVLGFAPVGIGMVDVVFNSGFLAVLGFVGGATFFSTVLGITEGRRRFDQMSLPRFAGWGALGGLLVSVVMYTPGMVLTSLIVMGFLVLLGAGSAAGSLALARWADDRELLEHGADVADIGLTEEEKRELLAE